MTKLTKKHFNTPTPKTTPSSKKDKFIDATLQDSFPASDPPPWTNLGTRCAKNKRDKNQ